MSFQNFGLLPELLQAIEDLGHTTPTLIQEKAIPVILKGSDVIGLAQTGTGKTAGFTLPLLHLLNEKHDEDQTTRHIRGLILAPTRELAAQIADSVKSYGNNLTMRSEVVFGGVNITGQIRKLQKSVDILIATPGRLLDLVDQRVISLSKVEILVLDEADRMLDMGFIHDVKKILALLPRQRQNMLFSATLSSEIQALANKFLHNHKIIEVAHRNTTTEQVDQVVYLVDQKRKRELISYLIGFNNWTALVFTRTKHGANKLCEQLIEDGLSAAAIHGNKSQGARTRALEEFKNGEIRVLVATDIAARGIDIEQLPYVINYELPQVAEDYVHRIGRTGRAGMSGNAISLVCADEARLLADIERLTKKTIAKKILPGYEPDKNIKEETMNNRSNRTRNTRTTSNRFDREAGTRFSERPSTGQKTNNRRFAGASTRSSDDNKRNNWHPAERSNSRSSDNRRSNSRSDSRPIIRLSENKRTDARSNSRSSDDNRRSNWHSEGRPSTRSSDDSRRSNWHSEGRPSTRLSDDSRRSNWRSEGRPSTRSSDDSRRGNFRSDGRPSTRTSEGSRRGNFRSEGRPSTRSSEGSSRGNFRSEGRPSTRSSEGSSRGNFRSDGRPSTRSSEGSSRGNFRSEGRPSTRSSEGSNRGNFRSAGRPSTRSSEGRSRGNLRSDSRSSTR